MGSKEKFSEFLDMNEADCGLLVVKHRKCGGTHLVWKGESYEDCVRLMFHLLKFEQFQQAMADAAALHLLGDDNETKDNDGIGATQGTA